jgi:uncharacterized protein YjdB
MNIEYLIQVLENKMNMLAQAKDQAFITGDLERITAVEAEILGVQDTLSKLKLIGDITQAATSTNTTETDVVAAGVEAVQNTTYASGSVIILGEYDLSTYATDSLYEQKLNTILAGIKEMSSVEDINQYIQSVNSSSPLTGQMVYDECQKYSVDIRLVLAILQLESEFGTAGVGANTLNPGNVGNTGTETKTYGSWQEGIEAVAEWLNRHRKTSQSQSILSSVIISPDVLSIKVGETQQLSFSILDQDGSAFSGATLVVSSDSTNVATVNGSGLVTAVGAGVATITATVSSGDTSVSKNLTVTVSGSKSSPSTEPVLKNISVSPDGASLAVGATQQLTIKTTDQNRDSFSGATISYVSDKDSVATVDNNGLVTAVGAGVATITATAVSGAETASGASTISVSIPAEAAILGSLTLLPSTANVAAGSTQQLTVKMLDQNGNDFSGGTVVFASDNKGVATVDNNGLVTAVSAGSATITASSASIAASSSIVVSSPETVVIPEGQ